MRRSRQKHLEFFALMDSLRAPRCPLCEHVAARIDRYVEAILLELVNDVGFRKKLASGGGFCNHHAYQLAAKADALGTVILFAASMSVLSARLLGSRKRAASAREACPVCLHAAEMERRYLGTLLTFEDEEDLRAAFRTCPGLCLPHLAALAREDAPPWLLSFHRDRIEALVTEVQRFVDAANHSSQKRGEMDRTLPGRLLGVVAGYHGRPAHPLRRSGA